MEGEGPRQGELPDHVAPAHEIFQRVAHDRNRRHAVRSDRRGPVGDLVPRQQVAGEPEGEGEQEEHHPVDPRDVPRGPVGGREEDPHHVQEDRHDHQVGRPVVDPPDEPPVGDPVRDLDDAAVRLRRRGAVIQEKEDAGPQEEEVEEERDPSEAGQQVAFEPRPVEADRLLELLPDRLPEGKILVERTVEEPTREKRLNISVKTVRFSNSCRAWLRFSPFPSFVMFLGSAACPRTRSRSGLPRSGPDSR